MEEGGPLHAPAALSPLHGRLCGPQSRSVRLRKIPPPPGFDPQTVQIVASRPTDCATQAHSAEPCATQLVRWNFTDVGQTAFGDLKTGYIGKQ